MGGIAAGSLDELRSRDGAATRGHTSMTHGDNGHLATRLSCLVLYKSLSDDRAGGVAAHTHTEQACQEAGVGYHRALA